jgi:hypothetical protein
MRRYVVLEPVAKTRHAPMVAGFQGRPVASFESVELALQFARDAHEHGRDVVVVDVKKKRKLSLSLLLPR